jgi:tryptophanase
MEYVVGTFEEIMRTREQVRGYRKIKESKFLRHFTAHVQPL